MMKLRRRPDYTGQVMVVTGAGSGIGRATAHTLAALGATVHVADLDGHQAEETAKAIVAGGGTAVSHRVDVSDQAAVEKLRDTIYADYGKVDVLINNAGIAVSGHAETFDVAVWRKVIDVNVMGVIHGVTAFGPRMLDAGRGHIINTASAAGLTPVPGLVPYATSKHAVIGLTESLNAEWSPRGVRVSAVCPGIVNTPIAQAVAAGAKTGDAGRVARMYERFGVTPESVAAAFVDVIEHKTMIRLVPRAQVAPEWWLRRLHPPLAAPSARLKQKMFGS